MITYNFKIIKKKRSKMSINKNDGESEAQSKQRIEEFLQKQRLPYRAKLYYAQRRAFDFRKECEFRDLNMHISVGGLDSITLLLFLRSIGIDVPAISVSILEDKSIQRIHKQLGVRTIKPYMSKTQVLNKFGFPVVSKEKARKISILQNPESEKQTFIHAIMTGDMGAQGKFKHSEKIKLPDKWIELFGGYYQKHRPDLNCKIANFPVSSECCFHMKEKSMTLGK